MKTFFSWLRRGYVVASLPLLIAYCFVLPPKTLVTMLTSGGIQCTTEEKKPVVPEFKELSTRFHWVSVPEVREDHYLRIDLQDRREALGQFYALLATTPMNAHIVVGVPEGKEGPVFIIIEGPDGYTMPSRVVEVNVMGGVIRQEKGALIAHQ